ncbi:Ribonuclease D (EC [Olavius sp. associated proteobacterium Delta 1]|nr:Ribonuclease D (EC [Olavius sp. associated proteobacterium Delta 1]
MKEICDHYQTIDTFDSLKKLARTIEKEKTIGVDLEADSMYHFKEKVCLIQMAAPGINAVIDPLMVRDLSPLKPIFKRRGVLKIFHGADYDVRSLYRDFDIAINNLFDTELASRFLGYSETGLEAVLKNKFDVALDKKFQRKDWSRRPLPQDMISYAAQDARYLLPLAQILTSELEELGRLRWVQEECEYLSNVRPNTNNTDPLYMHFKGAGKLDPRSLVVLETLLQFRRRVAAKKDKPLFRIFGNRSLLELADKKPADLKQLEKTRALSTKQISMYGTGLISAIQDAMQIEQENLPVYPRKKSPRVPLVVAGRVKALRIWRDEQVARLALDPALICTKALMSTIAQQKPHKVSDLSAINEMKNWQKKEFGQEIVKVLKQVR